MSRYIDADKLLLIIDIHGTNKFGMLDEDIREFINQFPTADVQEVKHGKWISTGHGGWHGDMIYRCSVCENEREAYIDEELHCPHCGAKMDGGKRE